MFNMPLPNFAQIQESARERSNTPIPYYDGVYKGTKGFAKSIAQIAYENGIGPDDAEGLNRIASTDPRAKEVLAAADAAGLGSEVRNRLFEFGNHFLKNEIIPDEAKKQQAQATNKAFLRADEYSRNLGKTIQDETSALRSGLATQLAQARGDIKQQENSRGMLYSGRRQKKEGEAANLASKQFAEGAGNIVQGAEQTKADLFGQANQLRSGAVNASNQAQSIMDRAKEARQSASAALQSQYASLLGQGIGSYAGGRDNNYNNKLSNNSQMPTMAGYNSPTFGRIGGG